MVGNKDVEFFFPQSSDSCCHWYIYQISRNLRVRQLLDIFLCCPLENSDMMFHHFDKLLCGPNLAHYLFL